MNRLRRIVLWCILIALSAAVFGSNTMRGLGEDLQKAGEAIRNSVN